MDNNIYDKLLYIGKSNKRFTHNKIYKYHSIHYLTTTNFNMTVYYNSNQMMVFKYKDYFNKNFKFINENEYNQFVRKEKLKRINNV